MSTLKWCNQNAIKKIIESYCWGLVENQEETNKWLDVDSPYKVEPSFDAKMKDIHLFLADLVVFCEDAGIQTNENEVMQIITQMRE